MVGQPAQAPWAVVQVGKRDGNVQHEFTTSDDHLKQLEPLVQRLNDRNSSGPKFDRKSLALLVSGLHQFMEDALGVRALYKPFPRLPISLLHDTSIDGPLFIIACHCAEFMRSKNLKRIDWLAPNFRKEYIDLLSRIRSELMRSAYVPTPHVYISPGCGAAAARLQEAVRTLKGEVATAEGTAGLTHVVHPAPDGAEQHDAPRYARLLEVKGASARVHWVRHPDSYDEWLAAAAVPVATPEPPRRHPRGPWHVDARWLLDSERFNEWMNPLDYETPEAAAEAKRKREAGEEEAEAYRAKAARQAGPLPEVQAGAGESVGEGVTRQRVLQPNRKALEAASAVDISQGQRPEGVLMPTAAVQPSPDLLARLQQQQQQQGAAGNAAAAEADGVRDQQGAAGPRGMHQQDVAAQQQRSPDLEPYLVPACAAWFRWDGIAEVEEAHFKDFFSLEGDNAERYRSYRNAIINKYREDPSRELSFTEARRALVGDVNLLRRIWKFLASWQLINFMARLGPHDGRVGRTGLNGVQGGMPVAGTEALYGPPRRATVEAGALAALTGNAASNSVRVRGSLFGNWARQPALATKAEFYCRGADCGALCTALRHHCLRRPDLDLCPKCYKEGKFPAGLGARDFIRLAASEAVPDESGWTDQETLLLLEGIEKYGESWQQVAEHVGGRSAMQCVARFLQLPVEEAAAEELGPGPAALGLVAIPPPGHEGGLAAAASALEGVLPFADVANPVLAQVSFLSAMVGPKVAAAAAQRALEVLAEEDAVAAAAVAGQLQAEQGGTAPHGVPVAGSVQPKQEEANGANGADAPLHAGRVKLAAATALAGAAVQAKLLADQEEREVQRLVLAAIDAQFKKVHAKLQYLEELDGVMASEKLTLEAMRGGMIDEYARAVAENVAAGLGPPPGRPPPAAPPGEAQTGMNEPRAAATAQ